MRTSQARQVGLTFLAVTLVTLAGAVWVTWKYELSMPETVVALLPTLGASYMTWAQFRVARQEAADQLTLGQVADQLAVAVQTQWEAEARHRRLYDPHPLPVAWQPTELSLVEGWQDLITTATSWPGGPPTTPASWATGPAGLAGSGNDLADTLARVPTGRLVVLGEPGAGKTMLLIRLLLTLLARRIAGGPVPVLVGLAGWNPIDHDLTSWLTSRLTRDHPGLAEPAPSAAGAGSRVQALVDHRLLLPILDGLDELPQPMLAQAITRLNDVLPLGQGVVVASRLAAYRTATTPATASTTSQTTTAPVSPSVAPAVWTISPSGGFSRVPIRSLIAS